MARPADERDASGFLKRVPWEVANELQLLRGELYDRAEHTAEFYSFLRRENLDRVSIEARAGVLVACQAEFLPNGTFKLVDKGTPSLVIEAFDEDAATVIDLVALPLAAPDQFATALGFAGGLGLAHVKNPASYFGGRPLRVHRTPLAWLKACCSGVAILREESTYLWLTRALGNLAVDDLEHGRALYRALHPHFDPARILVPQQQYTSSELPLTRRAT